MHAMLGARLFIRGCGIQMIIVMVIIVCICPALTLCWPLYILLTP